MMKVVMMTVRIRRVYGGEKVKDQFRVLITRVMRFGRRYKSPCRVRVARRGLS